MHRETCFTDIIQSVLNYARAFDEDNAVSFIGARVLGIVDDIILSNFLAASFKASYVRYIRVAKIMIKKEGVLHLLESLSMDASVVKMLGITHLDDPGL